MHIQILFVNRLLLETILVSINRQFRILKLTDTELLNLGHRTITSILSL